MPNPTVPDFTGVAARKLAELQQNGYRITGVCFERQTWGTQPQRGFIDSWGFVGWWRPDMQPSKPLTEQQRQDLLAASFCIASVGDPAATLKPDDAERIITLLHDHGGITAHGVADMKGGQDGN